MRRIFGRSLLVSVLVLISPAVVGGPAGAAVTLGPTGNALQPSVERSFVVVGRGDVPADAAAILLNITAVGSAGAGFLTAYPCGASVPGVSNLNMAAGQTVPNAVLVAPGVGGKVCIISSVAVDVLIDVSGYFAGGSDIRLLAQPTRVLDTRGGLGGPLGPVAAGGTLTLALTDRPAATTAAVVNITVTNPHTAGFVTVFACDQSRPVTSNLNFAIGQTVANLVVTVPSVDNKLCLYSSATTDVLVDFQAWLATDYSPLPRPTRVMSTRDGLGVPAGLALADRIIHFHLDTSGPASGARSAVLTATVTAPAGPGYLTVFSCSHPLPMTSNLNFVTGQTVANTVVVPIGPDGDICLFPSVAAHILLDLSGWLEGRYRSLAEPVRLADTRGCHFLVYEEDGPALQTPHGVSTSTAAFLRDLDSGGEMPLFTSFRDDDVVSTMVTFTRPLIGRDCYIYSTRTSTTVGVGGSTNVQRALLRFAPNTGSGKTLSVLNPSLRSDFNVIGLDPSSGLVWLSETLATGQSRLLSFDLARQVTKLVATLPGIGLAVSADLSRVFYTAALNPARGTRRLLEFTPATGASREVASGIRILNGPFPSPDGRTAFFGTGEVNDLFVDLANGDQFGVNHSAPSGWTPDSAWAFGSADHKTVSVNRNGSATEVLFAAHPAAVAISRFVFGP